jgi:hypothetical protein
MARRSRLSRVRRKRESRRAVVYIVLAIVIMLGLVTWGVPAMARLAGALFTSDSGVTGMEELSPTPPVFSDVPEATSSAKVTIGGFAQPGVEVVLVMDGSEEGRVLTNDAGVFEFDSIAITEGENKVVAYTVSARGKESEQSRSYTIRVDRTAPVLTLSSPEDGRVFRGQSERIAEFQGLVSEDGVRVYVGERVAIVSNDNTFELSYQLQEGDQDIEIKAVDKAGNESASRVKLRWEP